MPNTTNSPAVYASQHIPVFGGHPQPRPYASTTLAVNAPPGAGGRGGTAATLNAPMGTPQLDLYGPGAAGRVQQYPQGSAWHARSIDGSNPVPSGGGTGFGQATSEPVQPHAAKLRRTEVEPQVDLAFQNDAPYLDQRRPASVSSMQLGGSSNALPSSDSPTAASNCSTIESNFWRSLSTPVGREPDPLGLQPKVEAVALRGDSVYAAFAEQLKMFKLQRDRVPKLPKKAPFGLADDTAPARPQVNVSISAKQTSKRVVEAAKRKMALKSGAAAPTGSRDPRDPRSRQRQAVALQGSSVTPVPMTTNVPLVTAPSGVATAQPMAGVPSSDKFILDAQRIMESGTLEEKAQLAKVALVMKTLAAKKAASAPSIPAPAAMPSTANGPAVNAPKRPNVANTIAVNAPRPSIANGPAVNAPQRPAMANGPVVTQRWVDPAAAGAAAPLPPGWRRVVANGSRGAIYVHIDGRSQLERPRAVETITIDDSASRDPRRKAVESRDPRSRDPRVRSRQHRVQTQPQPPVQPPSSPPQALPQEDVKPDIRLLDHHRQQQQLLQQRKLAQQQHALQRQEEQQADLFYIDDVGEGAAHQEEALVTTAEAHGVAFEQLGNASMPTARIDDSSAATMPSASGAPPAKRKRSSSSDGANPTNKSPMAKRTTRTASVLEELECINAEGGTFLCKLGTRIGGQDYTGTWYGAKVLNIDFDRVYVHFDGWNDNFNEWVQCDSGRLKPAAPPKPPSKSHASKPPKTVGRFCGTPGCNQRDFHEGPHDTVMAPWHCPKCTLENHAESPQCIACGGSRPRDAKRMEATPGWNCKACNRRNDIVELMCIGCLRPNPIASGEAAEKGSKTGAYACGVCDRSYDSESGLKSHYKTAIHHENIARMIAGDSASPDANLSNRLPSPDDVVTAATSADAENDDVNADADDAKAEEDFKRAIEIGKAAGSSWLDFTGSEATDVTAAPNAVSCGELKGDAPGGFVPAPLHVLGQQQEEASFAADITDVTPGTSWDDVPDDMPDVSPVTSSEAEHPRSAHGAGDNARPPPIPATVLHTKSLVEAPATVLDALPDCSICLRCVKDSIMCLSCSRQFHSTCLMPSWQEQVSTELKTFKDCPLCRVITSPTAGAAQFKLRPAPKLSTKGWSTVEDGYLETLVLSYGDQHKDWNAIAGDFARELQLTRSANSLMGRWYRLRQGRTSSSPAKDSPPEAGAPGLPGIAAPVWVLDAPPDIANAKPAVSAEVSDGVISNMNHLLIGMKQPGWVDHYSTLPGKPLQTGGEATGDLDAHELLAFPVKAFLNYSIAELNRPVRQAQENANNLEVQSDEAAKVEAHLTKQIKLLAKKIAGGLEAPAAATVTEGGLVAPAPRLFRCLVDIGVGLRLAMHESSERSFGPEFDSVGEATVVTNALGIQYLAWKTGGFCPIVNPRDPAEVFFEELPPSGVLTGSLG